MHENRPEKYDLSLYFSNIYEKSFPKISKFSVFFASSFVVKICHYLIFKLENILTTLHPKCLRENSKSYYQIVKLR